MLGGGVPYCPWWGGPWNEYVVCPLDEPLRAGGRSHSGYNVVVPALEDCSPDLRRGVVTVCRWGGGVVVWGAEAGGAEGSVAGWCGGLFPLLRAVRVCWVVLLCWGPGSGGCGLDGLLGLCASTSTYGGPWLGSAGLGGAGWILG